MFEQNSDDHDKFISSIEQLMSLLEYDRQLDRIDKLVLHDQCLEARQVLERLMNGTANG